MILRRPLEWPADVPRKKDRQYGRFRAGDRPISVAAAVQRLIVELERHDAIRSELSAEFGLTRAGNIAQEWKGIDPGCCVRYDVGKEAYTLPCDTYDDLGQNIAALAAHLEAVRAIERYGVATTAQMMGAFAALPPPSGQPATLPKRPWFEVLGVFPTAPIELAEAAYKLLAKQRHPDAGGSTELMQELNDAIKEAREASRA